MDHGNSVVMSFRRISVTCFLVAAISLIHGIAQCLTRTVCRSLPDTASASPVTAAIINDKNAQVVFFRHVAGNPVQYAGNGLFGIIRQNIFRTRSFWFVLWDILAHPEIKILEKALFQACQKCRAKSRGIWREISLGQNQ